MKLWMIIKKVFIIKKYNLLNVKIQPALKLRIKFLKIKTAVVLICYLFKSND